MEMEQLYSFANEDLFIAPASKISLNKGKKNKNSKRKKKKHVHVGYEIPSLEIDDDFNVELMPQNSLNPFIVYRIATGWRSLSGEIISLPIAVRHYENPSPSHVDERCKNLQEKDCEMLHQKIALVRQNYNAKSSKERATDLLACAREMAIRFPGELTCNDLIDQFEAVIDLSPSVDSAIAISLLMRNVRLLGCIAETIEITEKLLQLTNALPELGGPHESIVVEDPLFVLSHRHPYIPIFRIRHSIDQILFIMSNYSNELRSSEKKVLDKALEAYRLVYARAYAMRYPTDLPLAHLSVRQWEVLAPYFNRILHTVAAPRLQDRVVNVKQSNEISALTTSFLTTGMMVIDNFLTIPAISALRNFLLASTIWVDNKHGYVGSFFQNGILSPLLVQISEELTKMFPGVFCNHKLLQGVARHFDDEMMLGVNPHADEAAVNANLFLTPDSAILDNQIGNLVLYPTTSAKSLRVVDEYQDLIDILTREMEQGEPNHKTHKSVYHSYQYNRLVVFRSDFIHSFEKFSFASGFENRRLTLSLLYGDLQNAGTC
jgi:hypothetical protein